jgi:hypothetical protein
MAACAQQPLLGNRYPRFERDVIPGLINADTHEEFIPAKDVIHVIYAWDEPQVPPRRSLAPTKVDLAMLANPNFGWHAMGALVIDPNVTRRLLVDYTM